MMSFDFGNVGRFDVPVVVGKRGMQGGVLILVMVKFSKCPKTFKSSLSSREGRGRDSGTCNGKFSTSPKTSKSSFSPVGKGVRCSGTFNGKTYKSPKTIIFSHHLVREGEGRVLVFAK